MTALLVSEEFLAPQGEGRNAGRLSYWIRLGTCNLTCRWCDSPYTWAFSAERASRHESRKVYDPHTELTRVSTGDLASRITASPACRVTVTGGEPLLQQEGIADLIRQPGLDGYLWDFETAGTVPPKVLAGIPGLQFTVSPKLESSGNPVGKRRNPAAISMFLTLDSVFKFVIDTRGPGWAEDIAEVVFLTALWGIPADRVYLMPCGTTTGEVISGMSALEKSCCARGWHLSARMQVLMHGDARGF